MLAVNGVYIAHYSLLSNRKKILENQLLKYGITSTWFEQEPLDHEVDILYNSNREDWESKVSLMEYIHPVPYKILNKPEISVTYKHLKMYERMIEENLYTCLILEDDVIFENNFINQFNLYLYNTPRNWDMIFIGSGCDLRIDASRLKSGKTSYLKEHPASKCADSYIIKKSSAEKILSTLKRFSFPIDFELNYQMYLHKMNVYWWDPPIVRQGSQCGLFKSAIQQ